MAVFRAVERVEAYCAAKGVRLIGDIPCSWLIKVRCLGAPELFKLNADGNPTVVAGVPPIISPKPGSFGSAGVSLEGDASAKLSLVD